MAMVLHSAVLNPEEYRKVRAAGEEAGNCHSFTSLAPRPNSLGGEVVYLVDTGFRGSGEFLDEMEAWIAAQMASVKTVRRPKTGNIFRDDTTNF